MKILLGLMTCLMLLSRQEGSINDPGQWDTVNRCYSPSVVAEVFEKQAGFQTIKLPNDPRVLEPYLPGITIMAERRSRGIKSFALHWRERYGFITYYDEEDCLLNGDIAPGRVIEFILELNRSNASYLPSLEPK